jgi:hypothetical protein
MLVLSRHFLLMSNGGCALKAIIVTNKAAGTAGMKLVEQPGIQAPLNDVTVLICNRLHKTNN